MSADNSAHVYKRPDGLFSFCIFRGGFKDDCPDIGYSTPVEARDAAYEYEGGIIEYGVSFSDDCFVQC